MSRPFLIIAFSTTYDAFAFEAACQRDGIEGSLIATPRQISAGCGYAWKTRTTYSQQVADMIRDDALDYESITELTSL